MFRDKGKFDATFIEADILDQPTAPALQTLRGKIDILYVAQVLHQWEWDKQVEGAKRLVDLSRPGTVVFGFQLGSVTPKVTLVPHQEHGYYRHDAGTWKKMWDQVGEETGTKWDAKATLRTWEEIGLDSKPVAYLGEDARMMDFAVTRME